MKKRTRLLLVAALVPAVVLGVAAPMALASGSSQRGIFDRLSLAAGMKGSNEVPPVSTGDPDAAGYGVVTIDPIRGQACVEDFAVGGTSTIVAFHIHQAAAGSNGPIVVDFVPLLPTGVGCVEVDNRKLLTEILLRPSGFYLNVHSSEFMGGAVRGQLVRVLG